MTLFLVLFPLTLLTADASMLTFLPAATNGWSVQVQPRLYSGREIFEYMDGAGEVYLAYHYRAVLVARYARRDRQEILVEIFDMGTSENAFGISTYMRGRGPTVRIGQDGEYRSGLLTFWRGPYYVCVRIEEESPEAVGAVRAIGRATADAIGKDGERPALLRCVPEDIYKRESLRYFFRDEILRTHITLPRDDMLLLSDSTKGMLVRARGDRSQILVVRYPDSAGANSALRSFENAYGLEGGGSRDVGESGVNWVACARKSDYVVAVIGAPARGRAEKLVSSILRRLP